jgi:hypothetical protein
MPSQRHWHPRHGSLHCSLCWHSWFPLLSGPIIIAQGCMKGQRLFILEICFFFSIYLGLFFIFSYFLFFLILSFFYSFLPIYYSTLYFFLLFQLLQVIFPVHILIAFCLFPFMLFLFPPIRLLCLFSSAFSALFYSPPALSEFYFIILSLFYFYFFLFFFTGCLASRVFCFLPLVSRSFLFSTYFFFQTFLPYSIFFRSKFCFFCFCFYFVFLFWFYYSPFHGFCFYEMLGI